MKFIEYLISQKLDVNALSCDGWTPLHLLVYSSFYKIGKIIAHPFN